MRVLVVGASGTIGRAVVAELGQRHEIVYRTRFFGHKFGSCCSLE